MRQQVDRRTHQGEQIRRRGREQSTSRRGRINVADTSIELPVFDANTKLPSEHIRVTFITEAINVVQRNDVALIFMLQTSRRAFREQQRSSALIAPTSQPQRSIRACSAASRDHVLGSRRDRGGKGIVVQRQTSRGLRNRCFVCVEDRACDLLRHALHVGLGLLQTELGDFAVQFSFVLIDHPVIAQDAHREFDFTKERLRSSDTLVVRFPRRLRQTDNHRSFVTHRQIARLGNRVGDNIVALRHEVDDVADGTIGRGHGRPVQKVRHLIRE